ncbi:hypothetical protein C5E45_23570 [Nocardia nova]|uniref:Helix-turn-helix domain-containing protein n=1 Tax=Nocardia nova TaxID=37330 RepID=A0A2S6AKP9_9NOCA|nr:hypothetical protein C5E45_23570 [Nocardia nova]
MTSTQHGGQELPAGVDQRTSAANPASSTELPVLYTPRAVARALGLSSPNWLEKAARRREIPHTRLGRRLRFTRHQVDQMIQLYAVHVEVPTPLPSTQRSRTAHPNASQPPRLQARIPVRMRNRIEP